MAKSVAERLIHAVRMQVKRGKIAIKGKERGAVVWETIPTETLQTGFRHAVTRIFNPTRLNFFCSICV